MRRLLALAVLLTASIARAGGVPPAGCIGSTVTKSWSRIDSNLDPNTFTTTAVSFTLQTPCYVTFDTDFVVTAKIVDERCHAGDPVYGTTVTVGNRWNITDTPLDTNVVSTIAGAGVNGVTGYAPMVVDAFGSWVTTVKQHYGPTGTATNHLIGFTFLPRGDSGCTVTAMRWKPEWIVTTTYDPYAPGTVDPIPPGSTDPLPGTTTDPGNAGSTNGSGRSTAANTSESGGCGSSGVAPALLGLAALVAAGWPRRRRARS